MRTSFVHRLATLTVALASIACGGGGGDSTGPGPGGTGQFRFTARVDGGSWASNAGVESVGVTLAVPGIYVLTGTQLGTGGLTLIISLYNISGPGQYPLGVGVSVPGGNVVVSAASGGGWRTAQSGADGTINITTLTANRMEGTFNFTAVPFTGNATGTKTVTDGSFVLEVKPNGTVGPLPENRGHKLSATLNGTSFNGADVVGTYQVLNGGTLTIAAGNNTRSVSLNLVQVAGTGTFPLSNTIPFRSLGVGVFNGSQVISNHTSSAAGSSGSVTITSFTSTRIKGTFNGVLTPLQGQATGNMTVTNGSFDIGRQ